ncbi:MAG: hypothetical protein FJ271_19435 [Planctomycetes bacterium]|nr:hypothetical protein [Planctomycetota bacterium]
MSAFLSGTWEHALLAKVVKEAAAVAQNEGGYLGRTAIQKIVYFLQVRNVPMRYRFDVHHFGPFCDTILADTEWLMADGVIVDNSPDPGKYSKFMPGSACDQLTAKYSEKLRGHEGTIRNTVKALLPLQPDHLELIATLDYAFRETRATAGKKPARNAVIARFKEFKREKFSDAEIAKTYDQLEGAGLFD